MKLLGSLTGFWMLVPQKVPPDVLKIQNLFWNYLVFQQINIKCIHNIHLYNIYKLLEAFGTLKGSGVD